MAGIGERIQGVRLRLDRSERSFAAALGVAPETVEAWEHGRRIDRDAVNLVAAATDTPVEWLIAGLSPAYMETIRRTAAPGRVPAGEIGDFAGDDRIAPQWFPIDEGLPAQIASAWKVRQDPVPHLDGGAVRPAVRGRCASAVFLPLADALLLSGARRPVYCWAEGRPENGRDDILLSLVLDGHRRIEQSGRVVEGGEGSAVFTSSVATGRFLFQGEGRYLGVNVRAEPLRERVPDIESRLMQPIAPDSAPLRLLSAYADSLMTTDGLDRDLATSVGDHFVDLCALLLGAEGDGKTLAESRGLRAAQRAAAERAIDAGAATPGFSALTVARQVGVSERYLYDLFLETGPWFWDRVNARRVEVARTRLADPGFDRLTVAELAFACGFTDLQRFERLFETQVGESPSDVRHGRKRHRA